MTAPIDSMLDRLEWKNLGVEPSGTELPFATHSAVMSVMGHELRCYQLSDGRRIFDADDVKRFFGLDVVDVENAAEPHEASGTK